MPAPDCFTEHRHAGDGLAVNQPTGGGDDYPFSSPSDVGHVVGDLYVFYSDHDVDFVKPFNIRWLYGFGCEAASVPGDISPTHDADAVIEDATGAIIFDSRVAADFRRQDWGDILEVLEWSTSSEVLRIVRRTAVEPGDSVNFPIYYAPASAVLDDRVSTRREDSVVSLRTTTGGSHLRGRLRLRGGYNVQLSDQTPTSGEGDRTTTKILVDCGPGLGEGQYGDGCVDGVDQMIRFIDGVGPDENGNVKLDALDCYRVDRPIVTVVQGNPRLVSIRNHTLRVSNDCGPCCDCRDYANVYEGLRRLHAKYTSLFERAVAVRDQYVANLNRFEAKRDCLRDQPLRVIAVERCPDEVNFTVGFCNNTGECIHNLILPISFNYTDVYGSAVTTLTPPGSLPSVSQAYRSGNSTTNCCENFKKSPVEYYRIGGTWPHYYAYFDNVEPGSMAFVAFSLLFSSEVLDVTDNLVSFAVDAFALPGGPTGACPVPIPDYDPATGPTSPTTTGYRVSGQPQFHQANRLQSPCVTDPTYAVSECF